MSRLGPRVGIAPQISDAELLTLAVMQALLGYTSETRWLRYARAHLLRRCSRTCPQQSGYNKRLRKLAGTMAWLVGVLGAAPAIADDDVWVVDSTPVECARSRETVKRSDLAGWAEYGYCASHSRLLLGTAAAPGVHPARAAGRLGADRREGRRTRGPARHPRHHPGPGTGRRPPARSDRDKNYYGRDFEATPGRGRDRPAAPGPQGREPRPGARFFKPLRQIIESINDTLKGQLDLERHGGRTIAGVCARIAQRILALTAAIWHNDHTRPDHPTITDRLRPLTPWNQSSSQCVPGGTPVPG